jgi:ParB/RepB/Spo0J family partition protein
MSENALKLGGTVFDIALEDLEASAPDRTEEDFKAVGALAESLKVLGQLTPILVSIPDEDGISHIIAGKRRFYAAKKAKIKKLKAVVLDGDDPSQGLAVIADNMHNRQPDPFLQAQLMEQLIGDEYKTQKKLADAMGVTQSFISKRLDLLKLDEDAQKEVRSGNVPASLAREVASKTKKAEKENTDGTPPKKVSKRAVKDEMDDRRFVKMSSEDLIPKDEVDPIETMRVRIGKNDVQINFILSHSALRKNGLAKTLGDEIGKVGDKELTKAIARTRKAEF